MKTVLERVDQPPPTPIDTDCLAQLRMHSRVQLKNKRVFGVMLLIDIEDVQ